jgi:hypothetical protein
MRGFTIRLRMLGAIAMVLALFGWSAQPPGRRAQLVR